MKTQNKDQFEDRIRFNWGYHDARHDRREGYRRNLTDRALPQQDKAYCEGYWRGIESDLNSENHKLSNWAWAEYQSS